MNEEVINSAFIKSIYTKTSDEFSPINPAHRDPYNTYWKWLDNARIFYFIRIPTCNGGLYKIGVRGKGREGGGGSRLREYYVSYGWSPVRSEGLTVLQVITFNNRKASQAGQKGSEQRWAEHEFEQRVKNSLKEKGIMPERGYEYFSPRDYDAIVDTIKTELKDWSFSSTETRRSARFNYEKPIPGDKIIYNFSDGSQFEGIVRGKALTKKGVGWFEIDFRDDPKYKYEYDGEDWDGFADRALTKKAFDPERERTFRQPQTWGFVKKVARPIKKTLTRERETTSATKDRQVVETSARAQRLIERAKRAERAIRAVKKTMELEKRRQRTRGPAAIARALRSQRRRRPQTRSMTRRSNNLSI